MTTRICQFLRRWIFIFVTATFVAGPIAVATTFTKDMEVRLVREAPLSFHDQQVRVGKIGEKFTVLQYNSVTHRVYVLASGQDGKPVALNVQEDAVEAIPDSEQLSSKISATQPSISGPKTLLETPRGFTIDELSEVFGEFHPLQVEPNGRREYHGRAELPRVVSTYNDRVSDFQVEFGHPLLPSEVKNMLAKLAAGYKWLLQSQTGKDQHYVRSDQRVSCDLHYYSVLSERTSNVRFEILPSVQPVEKVNSPTQNEDEKGASAVPHNAADVASLPSTENFSVDPAKFRDFISDAREAGATISQGVSNQNSPQMRLIVGRQFRVEVVGALDRVTSIHVRAYWDNAPDARPDDSASVGIAMAALNLSDPEGSSWLSDQIETLEDGAEHSNAVREKGPVRITFSGSVKRGRRNELVVDYKITPK